ncbi:hypothetical protein BX661DRAFT_179528 [Kickxella alabastrina]|uniref:uncharacterized protein n=1 Tax=Kickxella alabastrina TaxID=61397 RepID=UPI00221EF384|nr:uncharacterized protein BX661DRAFT_179528 [Kickxella alabastrina]KAI7831927.1 hypothetical protein BX661DRAFT_179528 [Kickxella alabastrina]
MGLCDAPEIREAYEDVRNDDTQTNWMLLEFDENKNNVLKKHLKDNSAAFGYIRVPMSNDELSLRIKFVFLVWAKLSVQKAEVTNVISNSSIEIAASEQDDLDENEIMLMLKKAGGANYDRQASDY